MSDELEKIIQLQDDFKGCFIVYVKPNNKNKVVEYDTDHAVFDMMNDKICFSFGEDELEDFSIKISTIKSAKVKRYDNMKIAFICLRNGNTIMIHFMD